MSDNNLEEKNLAEESAENATGAPQVEAHASSNEEVAETEHNEMDAPADGTMQADDAPVEMAVDPVEMDDQIIEAIEEMVDQSIADSPKATILSRINIEDFNWDAFENDLADYDNTDRKRLEDLYATTLSHVDERQVVDGTVVSINERDVVVNIGFKSDGMVPTSEFKYMGDDLRVSAVVKIMVEKREDAQGQIKLSHKKALEESAWETVLDAFENEKILRGYIADRTKGGMVVQLLGLDAFLPGSQIDVKPIKDYDVYVGTTMDLKVVKLNQQYRNIVVSHKAIIESDLEQQKSEILSALEKGQVLEGVVKNLTTFGVFVDLGGVDGLVHITDVSWGRINHPEEVLELGQKINCVVLDYDDDKRRISLGIKQLTQHPWETLPAEVVEGTVMKGKVVNIEDYGAFVEVYPGVEGLIHVSEMSWSTHLKSPKEYVKLGDEVDAVVITIDREERKLALGMKQLIIDPWSNIEERYPIGSPHEGSVRSMTNFGLFMELEEGIDGLVHISDFSWTRKYGHPAEFTKVGERMKVVVLDIDKDNRRLSLGYKQLEDDPWDTFESIFLVNSVHTGSVERIEDKGAIILLPYGVEAFAPSKHTAKQAKGAKLMEGESTEFKVLEFERDNRRIVVSHTQVWKDQERSEKDAEAAEKEKETEKTTKAVKGIQKAVSTDTLADANDILAGLKKDMEAEEREKQKEAMAKMDAQIKGGSTAEEPVAKAEDAPEAGDEPAAKAAKPKAKKPKAGAEGEQAAPEASSESQE